MELNRSRTPLRSAGSPLSRFDSVSELFAASSMAGSVALPWMNCLHRLLYDLLCSLIKVFRLEKVNRVQYLLEKHSHLVSQQATCLTESAIRQGF